MKASFKFLNWWFNVSWLDGKVHESFFSEKPIYPPCVEGRADDTAREIRNSLKKYLNEGSFECLDFEVVLDGYTDFLRKVYEALRNVPSGRLITYKELAEKVGKPSAARAVGLAMKKNRLQLFVPCHRVVGSNSIGGWSGLPGLKEFLINLESKKTDL